jgi:uncharacterized cupredoxin-like copper-binding protein
VQRKILATAVAIGLAVIIGACGGGDSTHNAAGGRTIDIDMRDNDFSPASVQVKAGEEVQFVFHNKGAAVHDAYIGDEAAQTEHEHEMRASSGNAHGGGHGTDGITVEPGKTATLSHTFDKSGTTIVGCHEDGHYVLGMRMIVNVT